MESGGPFSPATRPMPSNVFVDERTSAGSFGVASKKRARLVLVVSLRLFEKVSFAHRCHSL